MVDTHKSNGPTRSASGNGIGSGTTANDPHGTHVVLTSAPVTNGAANPGASNAAATGQHGGDKPQNGGHDQDSRDQGNSDRGSSTASGGSSANGTQGEAGDHAPNSGADDGKRTPAPPPAQSAGKDQDRDANGRGDEGNRTGDRNDHDDGRGDGDHENNSTWNKTDVGNGDSPPRGPTAPQPAPVEKLVLTTADGAASAAVGSVISGTKGADTLTAKTGHDVVLGGAGNDTIVGTDASVIKVPLAISATLTGAANPDAVSFQIAGLPKGALLSAGHDNGNGTWTLSKADLVDLSVATHGAAHFDLSVTARATDGSGLVQTASLHVEATGGAGEVLVGGKGNDVIYGSATGEDTIYGGGIPTGGHHSGHVSTVADNDTIHVGNGTAHVWAQAGNDTIYAGNGKGDLHGGSGNDLIVAGGGAYAVDGGSGFDTLDFSAATGGIKVDLQKHVASGFGDLSIKGIEAIVGSSHDDVIFGDKGANVLTGGGGNDVFGFHANALKAGAVDHITDFGGGDKLDFSELLKGRDANAVVKVTDSAAGEVVSIKVGKVFHDVVVLDGVHGLSVADLFTQSLSTTWKHGDGTGRGEHDRASPGGSSAHHGTTTHGHSSDSHDHDQLAHGLLLT